MKLFGRGKNRDREEDVGPTHRPNVTIVNAGATADQIRAAALQQAEQMRAAIQQAEQLQAPTAGGGTGGPDWVHRLRSVLAGPPSGHVKRCECTVCGAPKKLPSTNAYVYCDYCGSLVDFDLHRACESDAMPGPEYARLVNSLRQPMQEAKAAGDAERYREVQRQLFSAYVAHCPMAVSHRAKADEGYRNELIVYLAETAVQRAFDPEASGLEQEMAQRVAALRWTGTVTSRQVDTASFWSMTDTLARQVEVHDALNHRTGVTDLDPDKADFLQSKLAWSMFCQGWLRYLPEDAARTLLERTGLQNEYVPIQPEGAQTRRCSQCGGEIHALPGAKEVVCDGCGRKLDVTTAEITCGNCGATMTFPSGATHTACPYCKVDVERVGI
jgi:DNA-directed RNA polymerase subunit RPC12/RpoP